MQFFSDLDAVEQAPLDQPLVAASYSIYRRLSARGAEVLTPYDLLGDNADEAILEAAVEVLQRLVEVWFPNYEEDAEQAHLLYCVATFSLAYLARAALSDAGVEIDINDLASPPPKSDAQPALGESVSLKQLGAVWGSRWFGGYSLIQSSPTGLKLVQKTEQKGFKLWLLPPDQIFVSKVKAFRRYLDRIRWILGTKRRRLRVLLPLYRAEIAPLTLSPSGLAPDFETDLKSQIAVYRQSYQDDALSTKLALERLKRLPSGSVFDAMSRSQAAAAQSLRSHSIPRLMFSHGCMVAHGQGHRLWLAKLFAATLYNDGPCISQVAPRSPLQVAARRRAAEVIKARRLAAYTPASGQSGKAQFSVLLALGVQNWQRALYGLSTTCFEARRIAEALTKSLKPYPDILLNIRTKTSKEDLSKGATRKFRYISIVPEDLSDLYAPAQGIHNASLGSHSAYLEQADLVISGGTSAVVFEALERRKPLLILLPHAARVPALPAASVAELFSDAAPKPVYSANLEDDLGEVIRRIRDKHQNHTLTDRALAPYIWT